MYRSVITNLIGSICSPRLRTVELLFASVVGEVEHFPWGVMNNLAKTSPHMLQKVYIALRLLRETEGTSSHLSADQYEAYFCQVRSALPELDKKVTTSIIYQEVCSSSQLFADTILIIHSSRLFLMQ